MKKDTVHPQPAPAHPAGQKARNALGRQHPPLDGELSPHEVPSDKASAAVEKKGK